MNARGSAFWMSAKCARLRSRRFVPGQEQRMRRIGSANKWKCRAAEIILWAVAVVSFAGVTTAQPAAPAGQAAGGAQAAVAQSVGTVKAINGNVLTLTLEAGTDLTVNVTDT